MTNIIAVANTMARVVDATTFTADEILNVAETIRKYSPPIPFPNFIQRCLMRICDFLCLPKTWVWNLRKETNLTYWREVTLKEWRQNRL